MTYTHSHNPKASEKKRRRQSSRKYECLFMTAVNDPNYDERINNNAHKTQQQQEHQQLDLQWWKVSTRKSWDVWWKVLTIIFVHSVCQQQLHCIFDYLDTLQYSLKHFRFYFPGFPRWMKEYVRTYACGKKPLKFIHSTRLFPTHSLTVRANLQRITPLFKFPTEFGSLVLRLTRNFPIENLYNKIQYTMKKNGAKKI